MVPSVRSLVTPDMVRVGWENELAQHGPVTSIGSPASDPPQAGAVTVRVPVHCERGGFTLAVVVVDGAGLAGLRIMAAGEAAPVGEWQPAEDVDPDAFTEREVTFGPDPLAVGGTLSVPRHAEAVPGVVLLAGSGSQDRDETIGRNKLFKDLAWGLAARGVAVLRFDKVTLAHPDAVLADPTFTLTDEYVPHALAAIDVLRKESGVDPDRIVVLGHSLGGTVAPRVAAADPDVAGLVLLAAGAQPLQWTVVRQLRYLASLDARSAEQAAPAIETFTSQARRVDGPGLTPDTPSSELPFGLAAPYWLDLRDYRPAELAATLDLPILLLQGARDYQVTVADDLSRWQAALADRPDVTTRVYDAGNHLFFPGSGQSTPAEYEPAQHVDQAVIEDITRWLHSVRPRSPRSRQADPDSRAR